MKRTIVMLALGFLAAAAMAAGESPAAVQNLADRHIARGLKCESCHADAAHPAPVKKEKCLSCHGGSYEKLAEQTDSLEINPISERSNARSATGGISPRCSNAPAATISAASCISGSAATDKSRTCGFETGLPARCRFLPCQKERRP